MSVIPDLELRTTGAPTIVDTSPGGTAPAVAAVSDEIVGWTTSGSGYITIETYGLYLNGSPLPDGYVFQCACYPRGDSSISQLAAGPACSVPASISTGGHNINIPLVYCTNSSFGTGISTCIYTGVDQFANPTAGFINGAFYIGGSEALGVNPYRWKRSHILPFYLPVSVPAATIAGRSIDNNDSSVRPWMIASTPTEDNPNVTLVPYIQTLGAGAPYEAANRRHSFISESSIQGAFGITLNDGFGSNIICGAAGYSHAGITDSTNRLGQVQFALGAHSVGDLRTYRRGATSATYDWPGQIAFV